MIPLTKTLDPADLLDLAPELQIVDQYFTFASPQDPARRWEYALALRAITQHGAQGLLADVGGAGSPFWYMVPDGLTARVIDPHAGDEGCGADRCTLAEKLHQRTRLREVVVCLSVLEHVDDLDQFLYHLSCLVAPGGLLFLTMDCWDREGPDTAHFHWMRKRIFSLADWAGLIHTYRLFPTFQLFGEEDGWIYHGGQLYLPPPGGVDTSYSFASLALIKRS